MMKSAVIAAAVLLLGLGTASAQSERALIGREFMPKEGCEVKNGKQVLGNVSVPYKVQDVKDGWLNVGPGYVSRDHVVPLDEAVEYYTDYLRRHPQSAWAYNNRAVVWLKKWRHDRAIQDCDEALRLDPKLAAAYTNRGKALSQRSDSYDRAKKSDSYDRAIQDFDEALRLNPKDAAAYYYRGKAWLFKEDYERAIQDLGEAIRLNPRDASAYHDRGRAWFDKKDYDRAIQDLGEAIRLNPKDFFIYNKRGDAWFGKKDYDRAIQDYNEAIRLDPTPPIPYFSYVGRGKAWAGKQDYDRAIQDYNAAIRLFSEFPDSYYHRGEAWLFKKDYDRAIQDYNEAIRLYPQHAAAYVSLTWIYATCPDDRIRNGRKSVELGTKACELSDSKDPHALSKLACAYAEAGDFAAAVRWQTKANELFSPEEKQQWGFLLDHFKAGKAYREQPKSP